MARLKKSNTRPGSVRSGSITSTSSHAESSVAKEASVPPMDIIAEVSKEDVNVSFVSRHDSAASKSQKPLTGRQMHQRAGLVFPCLKIKKRLVKGNFAAKVQAGK